MTTYYKRIEDPSEGTELQYLGCYITRWLPQWTEHLKSGTAHPSKVQGFVEIDEDEKNDVLSGLVDAVDSLMYAAPENKAVWEIVQDNLQAAREYLGLPTGAKSDKDPTITEESFEERCGGILDLVARDINQAIYSEDGLDGDIGADTLGLVHELRLELAQRRMKGESLKTDGPFGKLPMPTHAVEVVVRQMVCELIRDNMLVDGAHELASSQEWIDAATLHATVALKRWEVGS